MGVVCGVYRFGFGLQASTNLSQPCPWGLWIVADVSFIALAAGGFVTAALAHVLHRPAYHFLVRPALLTALLGYTIACVLLAADLGRYYNIWHPLLPSMWQGNSALFEVGMCVMCYLVVLYLEFLPLVCERFRFAMSQPRLSRACDGLLRVMGTILPAVILLGIAISCLHQSSLGHVMVLAKGKLHPLWWSPILSLLFLLSALAVGVPTVLFVCLCAWRTLRLRVPMPALAGLARFLPIPLTAYLFIKLGDMLIRRTYVHLGTVTPESVSFAIELSVGLVLPIAMFLSARVRRSEAGLALASFLVMAGVVLNRANVYWIGFHPRSATTRYFPSLTEWGFTIGALAALLLLWRFLATWLPVTEAASTQNDPPNRLRAGAARRDSDARVAAQRAWPLAEPARHALPASAARARRATPSRRAPMRGPLALYLGAVAVTASAVAEPPGRPAAIDAAAPTSAAGDGSCEECHYCDAPSFDEPCLRRPCTRHQRSARDLDAVPGRLLLDDLEDTYLPVPFDHQGHATMAEMAEGCETCHHHTPIGRRPPPCRECHDANTCGTNVERLGLRGAYHQQCLACHREWMDPNACELCHRRRVESRGANAVPTLDDMIGRMHPPVPEPTGDFLASFVGGNPDARVVFRHEEHARTFGLRCVECHREANCARCHAQSERGPSGRTLLEHHAPCIRCHKDDMSLPGRAADRCVRCHWVEGQTLTPPFDHATTGWTLRPYHRDVPCRRCHPQVPFASPPRACETCHAAWDAGSFDHAVTGWPLDATHREVDCAACHAERRFDVPPTCAECHEKDPRQP